MNRSERALGFSLPELLVALAAALLLAAAVMQGVLLEARGSQRLAARQQQQLRASRAMALIRAEAARAQRLVPGDLGGMPAACTLAGRRVLLQLLLPAGPITYTVGSPPSAIWRGVVLMRCGPAYGLDGEPSTGAAQNRVLLDGLQAQGTQAERISAAVVRLQLQGDGRLTQLLAARD